MAGENKINSKVIHTAIGVAIMLFFRFIPNLPHVTDTGMEVFGIFIGTLYLWTFCDTIWSSLLSIALLALSSYAPVNEVLAGYWGNATILFVFFMYVVSGSLVYYHVTDYIAQFFLTRKFTSGKPWLFIFVIGIGAIFLGGFSSPFTSILLFWPVMDEVMTSVGYETDDKFPQVVRILVVIAGLIGFPITPFMQNGLVLIQSWASLTESLPNGPEIIPPSGYFTWTLIMAGVLWTIIILFCKFVLRPDTEKLKSLDIKTIEDQAPPPMNTRQKVIGVAFGLMILSLLVPSLVQNAPGMDWLSSINRAIPLLVIAILTMIHLKDGKPVIEFTNVVSSQMSWGSFFIICTAIYIGNALTHESTGISAFLNWVMEPILGGLSGTMFTVVILLICAILTNLGNSLVIGILIQPVILSYYQANPNIDIFTINTLVIYFTLASAAILPSSSPFAAMLHGNETVETGMIYKTTIPIVLLEYLLVVLIGLPLGQLIYSIFV